MELPGGRAPGGGDDCPVYVMVDSGPMPDDTESAACQRIREP